MQISEFKKAVGKFPTGVCVISTIFDEKLWGLTANSFVSVSLSPPLISFCLDKNSGSFVAFQNSDFFSVNILANDQEEISKHFAQSFADKFSGIDYDLGQFNVPHIKGIVSLLECKKYSEVDGGDHVIFIGEVLKTQVDDSKLPMLYYARSYRDLK